MNGFAYYNGKIGFCDEISIPLTDRTIYFGDAVYDVIVGNGNGMFLPDEHIDRLFSNMEKLFFPLYYSKNYIYNVIYEMINMSKFDSYLVYVSLSRNSDERTHSFLSSNKINLFVIVKEFSLSNKKSLNLITVEDKRYYYCDIKTPNLLPAVLYSSKADSLGCDEAILLRNNIVTECAHSNLFILKDETLYTHPKSELILPGITRSLLISEAKKINIPVIETPFNLEDIFLADEIIITSTTKLIKNTLSIDKINVGGNGTSIFSELEEIIRKKFQNNN